MAKESIFSRLQCIGCETASDALLVCPKLHIDQARAHEYLQGHIPIGRVALYRASVQGWLALDREGNACRSPFPASIELRLNFLDSQGVRVRFFGMKSDEAKALMETPVVFQASARVLANGMRVLQGARLSGVTGRVQPQYVGVPGQISGEKIVEAVQAALATPGALEAAAQRVGASPAIAQLLQRQQIDAQQLLRDLHQPSSIEAADRALQIARTSVVQEIRAMALAGTGERQPARYNIDQALIALVQAQAETLSQDQRRALNAIRVQVNGQHGARILLNGDVGTGKTLVFLLAIAAIAQTSGGCVGVVVPSDLVARQIHAQASRRFADLLPHLVIAGSEAPPEGCRMLIGTQALLSRAPALEALVVDEQHKFSVAQRSALAQAGTHIIEASATPIPRSLALALFDGWQQVRIVRSPVAKVIHSRIATAQERSSVTGLVRSHLECGRKVIFLYPKVNGPGASVRAAGERLAKHFDGRVAVLHGQMASDAKAQALQAFASGAKPIIVASVAVEVGVDVPDIGLMVVSGADRFGAAQLHQLRGRLARNGGQADFIMLLDKPPGKETGERLRAVCEHPDGFSLAERDMQIRGFGDVLGEFQTGKSLGTFKLPRLEVSDFTN